MKLLRFLQQKEVTPLGDSKAVKVDVRVIAATHRDLKKNIADGSFREDLYYRLNVISMELPPLDQRPEDIPVLASHFLHKYAPVYGGAVKAFSSEAMAQLVQRSWSGNVRELENVVQRAIVSCDGPVIELAHLTGPSVIPSLGGPSTPARGIERPAPSSPPTPARGIERPVALQGSGPSTPPRGIERPVMPAAPPRTGVELPPFQQAKKDAIDHFEREYLEELLQRAPRMTDAADLAGVDRKGLWRLLKKHGLRSRDAGGDMDEPMDPEAA